ncbi:3-hydroxyacyl-CoA dehydrogenase NAD-binding domain-containing protein [Escherichia coli]|nr:3-hydroxyacyl-CoA dehydrogenase NAD-binding domain-containing protein [Escherichia coli]
MDTRVLLYDISAEALTRAIDGIHARLNSRVTRGKLTAETCERTLKRADPGDRYSRAGSCGPGH